MNSREILNETNYGHLLERPAIVAIANGVSANLNRPIKSNESEKLIDFIKNLDYSKYKGQEKRRVFAQIAESFYTMMQNPVQPNFDIDYLHDHMKNELTHTSEDEHQYKWTAHADRIGSGVSDPQTWDEYKSRNSENSENSENSKKTHSSGKLMDVLGKISTSLNPNFINNIFERARSSIPGLQTYDNITFPRTRLTLDSRNKVASSPEKFLWYLNSARSTRNAGNIKLNDTLQEIISIKINEFWLPMQNPLDFYYSSVYMNIPEIPQNVVSTEFLGAKEDQPYSYNHHFEFKIADYDNGKAHLIPMNPEFKLKKPLAQLNSISLEFRSPLQQIRFLQDRGSFTATYGNPTLYSLNSGTHNLNTGDLVYILKSDSGGVVSQEITRASGHFITRINSQEFTISLDSSASTAATENNIIVYYGSQRLIANMEFTSLQH